MTLAETLLPKLADWRPAGEGRHAAAIALPDHGWTVHLSAEQVDTLGCRLRLIELTRDQPLPDDAAALEAHARKAPGRATGLLEPLRVVEMDTPRQTVLVRSDGPKLKGDTVAYYEVRFVGRNRVTVERFQATKASPARREAVPFALTHEGLAKLVEDLVRD
jgi:hypothetical protein